MLILENLGVHGHEWRIEYASCGNDNLVGWIAMKSARKLSGLDADARRKLDELNAGIRERLPEPIEHRTGQSEPPALNELGDLPTRNRANGDAGLLSGIEQRTSGSR